MARNLKPRGKQERRIGEKLFLKGERDATPKSAITRRNYPPGQHGPKGAIRVSAYGLQLREKQKAKLLYGILERQFRRYYETALKKRGNTSQEMSRLLETRLDTVVRRLGLSLSQPGARQLVTHGHITVNGTKVDVPSYAVKTGDKISVSDKAKKNNYFTERSKHMENISLPTWMTFDASTLTGTITDAPAIDELKQNINMQMIVEFYSR